MKKHSKKFFAALALILALACALTACAPAAASSGNAESKASETPASSKVDEKPVTLKYINYGAKPDTGNCDGIWKAMNDILLKDLNCTVDVEYLGSGDKAQMALKYAGNEKFDFAYTASWFGLVDNAQSNAFYELSMDELKQYAPYMVENLPDVAWKQASVDGKIYVLPDLFFGYSKLLVAYRGDLREKYGMNKLETMEDLEKYAEQVKKNESEMETLDLTDRGFWINYPDKSDANAWVYEYTDPTQTEFTLDVMCDDYLIYAKKMREYYDKGYNSPDLINDSIAPKDKFINGTLSVCTHNNVTINKIALQISKEHPEWKIEIFNPYKGRKVLQTNYVTDAFAITRTSEHPTKVMEVVNHIFESVELQKLLNFGVEGIDYEMKDGKLYTIADVPADKKINLGCNWNMVNHLVQNQFVVADMYEGYREIIDDFEKNTIYHPLQAFVFDKSEVETEVTNMDAVNNEYKALNYGMYEDVEGTVAEYRAALKAAGYDKVKAEYDRQVKEFMATYNN